MGAREAPMRTFDGPVDVCIVGCGAGGSVLAKELAEGVGGWLCWRLGTSCLPRRICARTSCTCWAGSIGTTAGG